MTDDRNRVEDYAADIRRLIASGRKPNGDPIGDVDALESELDLTFAERIAWQDAQALAHASGILSTAEAQTVYRAIGEAGSESNGGWPKRTDLAMKVTVTNLMAQIMAARAARR